MKFRRQLVVAVAVAAAILTVTCLWALAAGDLTSPSPCTNCVRSTISVGSFDSSGSGATDIAYDGANGNLYVAVQDRGSSAVTVINGSTGQVYADVESPYNGHPEWVTYDPRNGDVYAANALGNNVSVIDGSTNKIVETIPLVPQGLGYGPQNSIYDAFTGYVVVAEAHPAWLLLINGTTNRIVGQVSFYAVGGVIGSNPTNGELYGAANASEMAGIPGYSLDVLNGFTGSLISSFPMNGTIDQYQYWPAAIEYDPITSDLLVASYGISFPDEYFNGTVAELNAAATRIESVSPVGEEPTGLALDPANGNVYSSNFYSTNVSILNSSTLAQAGAVSVGQYGTAIADDAQNGCLYVVQLEGSVSVVAPPGGTCPAPPPAMSIEQALILGGSIGAVVGAFVLGVLWVRESRRSRMDDPPAD